MTAIEELESQIRDFVNAPRRQAMLLADAAAWAMLCSSLDVIGDAELAIVAYLSGETQQQDEHTLRLGRNYLVLYGILQVLFAQQDAVQHLAEALGIDYTLDRTLKDVRENRNDAVGHPTKRGSGKAFNFISRISLSSTGCRLLTVFADGKTEFKNIDVPSMIAVQRKAISAALSDILAKLKEDETEHRRRFRDTKLANAFAPVTYCHERINASIEGTLPNSIGAEMLREIVRCISNFNDGLSTRGPLDAYTTIVCELGELDYPITQLEAYFLQPADSKLNEIDAHIMHFFIFSKLRSLRQVASEIDHDYARDV